MFLFVSLMNYDRNCALSNMQYLVGLISCSLSMLIVDEQCKRLIAENNVELKLITAGQLLEVSFYATVLAVLFCYCFHCKS